MAIKRGATAEVCGAVIPAGKKVYLFVNPNEGSDYSGTLTHAGWTWEKLKAVW